MRHRGASSNAIASYRDTFRLLFSFTQERLRRPPSKLALTDLDAHFICAFLDDLEARRSATARTRNLRLTAIRSLLSIRLFRSVGIQRPHSACAGDSDQAIRQATGQFPDAPRDRRHPLLSRPVYLDQEARPRIATAGGANGAANFLVGRPGPRRGNSFAYMVEDIVDTKAGRDRVEIRTGVGRHRRWSKPHCFIQTIHKMVEAVQALGMRAGIVVKVSRSDRKRLDAQPTGQVICFWPVVQVITWRSTRFLQPFVTN